MALHQPLAIGEAPGEGPNSVAIAQAIADFARRSDLFTYCQNPPYSATSYIKAFTGSPPSAALTVSVRRNVVELRDPYDLPVTARVIGYGELVRAPRRAERGTPRLVRPALAGVPVPAATLSQFQVLMPNLRVWIGAISPPNPQPGQSRDVRPHERPPRVPSPSSPRFEFAQRLLACDGIHVPRAGDALELMRAAIVESEV